MIGSKQVSLYSRASGRRAGLPFSKSPKDSRSLSKAPPDTPKASQTIPNLSKASQSAPEPKLVIWSVCLVLYNLDFGRIFLSLR